MASVSIVLSRGLGRVRAAAGIGGTKNVAFHFSTTPEWVPIMNTTLKDQDPVVHEIIQKEKDRQLSSLQLIASENFTSKSVFESLGSCMANKYSEGYPGKRYYGGTEFIDEAETLCQNRALEVFGLDPKEWGVNVQALSGSPANLCVFTALLEPHDKIMSLDLPHGGHLSHGYQTDTKKISAVSKYFSTFPYRLDESTGIIDYDTLEENAKLFRPKLLIAGASAYPRHYDYARMRKVADNHNAWLLADMAHISGLVAAGVVPSPFSYADIVTTTTHKSLRGPRGAMIFYRKGTRMTTPSAGKGKEITYDGIEDKINEAVFPGVQGGPHNHTITALAVALGQCQTESYLQYQRKVITNASAMAGKFQELGYSLVSNGTDNHLILVDTKKSKGIDGSRVEIVCTESRIALNKNTVPGDKSALRPSGVRIGTPAMTTRGFDSSDFEKVAELVDEAVKIATEADSLAQGRKISDFKSQVSKEPIKGKIEKLKSDIREFTEKFPVVGI